MRRALAVGLAMAVMSGAQATSLDSRRAVEQDYRLRYMSEEFEIELRRAQMLIENPELDLYLNEVMHRLFPEASDQLRVGVLRSAHSNAFALPNGSIYLNAGLLARLHTESQLAMILAHEGEHYLQRHGVRSALSVKATSAVGMVIDIAVGVPITGVLLVGTSYAGFSRELEREADELGFHRVEAAGYAVNDAHIWFERMAREAKALKRRDGSMFASHPKLADREQSLQELAEAADEPEGDYGQERFLAATEAVRLAALNDMVAQRHIPAVVLLLEEEGMLGYFPPTARYYLGEAYRLRGDEGDEARAAEQYQITAGDAPEFASVWRGLGMYEMRRGDPEAAVAAFERYRELAPDASDVGFIARYIEQLSDVSESEGESR